MVDSRLKNDPSTLFHCFFDIHSPKSAKESPIELIYPDEFNEQELILKQVPGFCYPCDISSNGVEYSTFVLTDLESKFRFGFCRYPAKAEKCLCMISYLPWFKTFYTILDRVSQIFGDINESNKSDVCSFLEDLNNQKIPDPGSQMFLKYQEKTYTFVSPDTTKLPTIPDNRNLTKYYAKISPENMVNLFVSMMFERRIIVTSQRLGVLTAVIHGSVSLLYPMQWQHIYVPILPPHLIDYCCAPMPFLLGIHASMMPKVRQMPMNEVVILNADTNEIEMPDDDLESCFPKSVISKLVKRLSRTEKAMKDYVSSLFLEALADLIGGYKESLKFVDSPEGGRIVFDDELFLTSRRPSRRKFLESILGLQSFRQFIAGRLDLLNDGVEFVDIFEKAILKRNDDIAAETKLDTFKDRMKKGGGAFKKTVEGKYSHLKGIASEIEVKEEMKDIKKKLTEKMKKKKKEKELRKQQEFTVKRNNSMPPSHTLNVKTVPPQRHKTISSDSRHSLYSSLPKKDNVTKPGKTPPPRPPRPATLATSQIEHDEDCRSVELPRKLLDAVKLEKMSTSHSENNISSLLNLSSSTSSLSSISSSSLGTSFDSLEHQSGAFFNPAFNELADDNKPLVQPNSVSNEDLLFESEFTELANRPKASTALKCGAPVKPNRTPPQRPPPISPTRSSSVKPSRPPPPVSKSKVPHSNSVPSKSSEELNEGFLESTITDSSSERRSIVMSDSPFYSPASVDLLDLDQSLFHEIGSSLSEDTRTILALNKPLTGTNKPSQTNPFTPANMIMDNTSSANQTGRNSAQSDMNIIFEDENPLHELHRSPVLTPSASSKAYTKVKSSVTDDPFASCFEDAKKEFQFSSKSLMKNRNHVCRTVSLRYIGRNIRQSYIDDGYQSNVRLKKTKMHYEEI